MDDMASALGSILNNPQTMQQIMSLASQLGLGGPAAQGDPQAAGPAGEAAAVPAAPAASDFIPPPAAAPPVPPAAAAPAQPVQPVQPVQQAPPAQAAPFPFPFQFPQQAAPAQPAPASGMPNLLGNLDLNTIGKISQILSTMNTRDSNVELLMALKPHFGEKRKKKVDDAIRIMQLVKVLPLLKETGIFGSLLGGDDS